MFGGFTYTEDLSQFVDKVLSLLEVGGGFYTLVPGVHLEDGKDKLGVFYLTELENAVGRPEKVCSWLKKTTCVKVTCESKSDWKRPTELIKVEKVCSDTSVPRMKLCRVRGGISSRQAIPIGAVRNSACRREVADARYHSDSVRNSRGQANHSRVTAWESP